jgi:VanZ family protein
MHASRAGFEVAGSWCVRDYAGVQKSSSPSRRTWLWPVLVAALIFGASGQSQVAQPGIPHIDKVVHFCVYALLATMIVRTGVGGRRAPLVALLLASLYGVSDEVHQRFVPGRSMEFADWVADTLGAAVAIWMYARWTWYRVRLEAPVRRKRRIENADAPATVPAP